VIAPLPLGGYVKMLGEQKDEEIAPEDLLGEQKDEEIAPEDLHRAFNRKPLWVRTAIVAAGPLFNFLFAIVAYTIMFMVGVTGMKALVGDVVPHAYTIMFMVGVTGMKALVGDVVPHSLAEQAGFRDTKLSPSMRNRRYVGKVSYKRLCNNCLMMKKNSLTRYKMTRDKS